MNFNSPFSRTCGLALLAAIWSVAVLVAPAPAHAQRVSSDFAPRSSNDVPAEERVEALELRLSQLEQLLEAQRTLQTRTRLTETQRLQQRIDALEAQIGDGTGASAAPVAAVAPTALPVSPIVAASASTNDAALQVRFNQMAETLRLLQGETDRLILRMQDLTDKMDRAAADNEFRFQSLASGVMRANQGISSSSSEPEVIGFVKTTAPVSGLVDASTVIDVTTPLVGEGKIEDEAAFEGPAREPLNNPVALYNRGLKDLQAGDYAGARVDFAEMVEKFPQHKLSGNAQYWLGETFYVQRQYKQAAEAFLAGYTTYAESGKAPDSLLKLGMTLTALGEKQTGCNALAELDAKFPNASPAIAKRAQIEKKRANCGS